jgi:hypothetical protein
MTARALAARLLLVLAPVLLCAAQQQRQLSSPAATVDGVISDANTAEPVGGATLHLVALRYLRGGSQSQPQATSGADGAFHFDGVSAGTYVITAERSGYVANKLSSKSRFITVTSGQSLTGVTVSLARAGVISGLASDETGAPLPGTQVEALAAFTTYGQTSLELFGNSTADRQGRFVLSGLPANSYYLLAKPVAPSPSKEGELVQTFYPRSVELEGAATVPVGVGESVDDIAIRIRRTATYHIRGRISDIPLQSGSSGLTLTVSPAAAANSLALARKVTPAPNRSFDVPGLTSGEYILRLTSTNGSSGRSHALLARQEVEIGGGDISGVVLSAMPPLTIAGQVRVDSSSNDALPSVSVSARPLEDVSHGSMGFTKVASDGSFALNNLDPGLYLFQAHPAAPGWYVKSMTLNGRDVLNQQADLSDMTAGRLEILVSPGAGQVNVTVLPPSGSSSDAATTDAGNTVVLAPEIVGPDGSGALFGFARQNASFSFKNVRPGKYFCYVAQQGDPNLWQNPDFLKAMQALGTPVEVAENGSVQIQLAVLALDDVEQTAARVGFQLQ